MHPDDILDHNQKVLQSLKKGDLIEIEMRKDYHWAVYNEQQKVIHLVGGEKANNSIGNVFTISGVCYNTASIKEDDFFDVTGKSIARKNNSKDGTYCPSTADEIVKLASEKLNDEKLPCDIMWNKCEHFAFYCRYGNSESYKESLKDHNNTKVLKSLHEGDIVEFERGMYSHWAVFVGKKMVIHLAGDKKCCLNEDSRFAFTISGKKYYKATVRKDTFWDVTGDFKAFKNNHYENDNNSRPSTPAEIVKRASDMLEGGNICISLKWSTCKYFAFYCRYGDSESYEVWFHNTIVLERLNAGDLVEFERGMYSHWAVFVGDGEVSHLAGDINDGLDANVNIDSVFTICGKKYSKASVRQSKFWDVTGDSVAFKNNRKDRRYRPATPKEIVERALQKKGPIGYNVLWRNCEHFASYCRYGKSISDQVSTLIYGWGSFIIFTPIIVAVNQVFQIFRR